MLDRFRQLFGHDRRRNEILQTGGKFTVRELREFGLGPETKDKVGNTGRELLYINDIVPVRLVPRSLLQRATILWTENHDIKQTIESLYTSFYIFRECVNTELEVPLIKKEDNIWEWPEPEGFSWGDEQTKTYALLFGAYEKRNEVELSVTEGNTVHTLLPQSGIVSSTEVADLIAHPDEHIRFSIPSLNDVRMINQQAWQQHALQTWAGYGKLGTAFDEILERTLDTGWADNYFMSMVIDLDLSPITMPVVRYASKKEQGSMNNLYIMEL